MDNGQGNGSTPAKPFTVKPEYQFQEAGLTKREHFAGLAMQALLSNSSMGDSSLWDTPQEWVKQMTETGVEMADALLKELSK